MARGIVVYLDLASQDTKPIAFGPEQMMELRNDCWIAEPGTKPLTFER